jgi:hypothetical protein
MNIDYETIFCFVDDFCKGFLPWWNKQLINDKTKKRNRDCKMSMSEIVTILIAFHQSGFSCFQKFYFYLLQNNRKEFPKMLSYSRFITLVKRTFPVLMTMFDSLKGDPMVINFIDSTKYEVCKVIRAKRHKVFKGLAKKSKTSTGWFFGMKLHMIFNLKGEIVKMVITPGNVDDRAPVSNMIKNLFGKLFGDRGYISKEKFKSWLDQGVQVVTGIKKNMKNILMNLGDKVLLRRRGFLETIFSSIKSLRTFEHSRHRSVANAICHIFAGLIHYQMRDDKPSLINEMLLA